MRRIGRADRGDTIVEVLFAMTIFSLVAVGGISLMNQGLALAQQSLEIGLVRQQIDAQADALRYLNRAYVADFGKRGNATQRWQQVVSDNTAQSVPAFDSVVQDGKCNIPDESFAIDLEAALDFEKLNVKPTLESPMGLTETAATYAKVRYDDGQPRAEGIWIQALWSDSEDEKPGFYDFHIRACWFTPGQLIPITLGTIVRLYEPHQ